MHSSMDKMPYFFEEELPANNADFELSPETSKHLVQVLRMKEGTNFLMTDGRGKETVVQLILADKKKAKVAFVSSTDHLAPEHNVAIAISLLKNESRFEWFLEKATEIGITAIYPLICERTERNRFRMDRMKNITISAMLQSRQVFLPQLSEPITLGQLFKKSDYQQKYIAHCNNESDREELLPTVDKHSRIILIGPEGDFTSQEVEDAMKQDYRPVSLGATRLRTETAGIVAAVLLLR